MFHVPKIMNGTESYDEDSFVMMLGTSPNFLPDYLSNCDIECANARICSDGGYNVEYVNLDKPYKVNMSSDLNYHKYLRIVPGEDEICSDSQIGYGMLEK